MNASPGWPSGITRCAVSAVSVVDIGQMCRSCTSATPGSRSSAARTADSSTPSGTALRPSFKLSRASPHVPQPITARMTRLVTGSSHTAPVSRIATPAITTPTDTSASAAMCRNAPRMLRSSLRRRTNSSAVTVLMTMPTPATQIIVQPSGSTGFMRRSIVSNRIAPMAIISSAALASAARMVELFRP